MEQDQDCLGIASVHVCKCEHVSVSVTSSRCLKKSMKHVE